MSDTPRTDALTDADFKNIDEDMETATLQAYNRLHDLCAELERELAEVTKQRDEIAEAWWATEDEINEAWHAGYEAISAVNESNE